MDTEEASMTKFKRIKKAIEFNSLEGKKDRHFRLLLGKILKKPCEYCEWCRLPLTTGKLVVSECSVCPVIDRCRELQKWFLSLVYFDFENSREMYYDFLEWINRQISYLERRSVKFEKLKILKNRIIRKIKKIFGITVCKIKKVFKKLKLRKKDLDGREVFDEEDEDYDEDEYSDMWSDEYSRWYPDNVADH